MPFTFEVPIERQNRNLPLELRNDAAGILRWMLRGFTEWRRYGLGSAPEVAKATEEYFTEQNTIGRWIEDRCTYSSCLANSPFC